MKKNNLFIVIFLMVLASCSRVSEKTIITSQIEYDVSLNNRDKNMSWWIQNIEGPSRDLLINTLLKTSLSEKYKLTAFTFDSISKNWRHEMALTTAQLTPYLTQEFIQNINKLRFREIWTIDKKTLKIFKKVTGIAPVVALFNDSGAFMGNKLLYWMTLDSISKNQSSKKVLITKRIQYDVFIKNTDSLKDWWMDNIEQTDREKFARMIIDKISSSKIKLYDFPFNTLLKDEDRKNILHPLKTVTLKRNKPPYDSYDTTIIQPLTPDKIIKIRFLEEWTLDPDAFELNKNVLGIAPITETYGPDGAFRGYTPLFWIYFDEHYPADDMKL